MSRTFSDAYGAWIEEPDDDLEGLLRYHEGRLAPEPRRRMEERLEREPQLALLLADLRAFDEAEASEAETATEFEVAATRRWIQAQAPPSVGSTSRLWMPWMAALLVACLGLGWGWQSARRELVELRSQGAPSDTVALGAAQIHHLLGEAQVRGGPVEEPTRISTRTPTQVLVITLEDPPAPGTVFNWRLISDGERVTDRGTVAVDVQGLLILSFPSSLLAPGAYALEMTSEDEGAPVRSRHFKVEGETRGATRSPLPP